MRKELLLQQQQQQQVNPLQNEYHTEDSEEKIKDKEHEIECPRCNDIMALSSDFDRLCYLCQECDLSLLIN
jgi:ribosomal protein S27AE